MKRRRFSEDQIVRILEEFEAGKSVEELCREPVAQEVRWLG
jgi:hypothetical protein